MTDEMVGAERLVKCLLARWEAHAWLQESLETEARNQLAGAMRAEELEDFIEQQIATDQTELLVEFFWVLSAKGCATAERMAEWIDRHNALVGHFQAELEDARQRKLPLGAQHKKRLWRLEAVGAYFSKQVKAACCARLDGSRIVLSLKDLERFMALHMDVTLCRDRLDALVQVKLLDDELRPNLRLFRSTERLEALAAAELEMLAMALDAPDGPAH
jgi:hypothetical protein